MAQVGFHRTHPAGLPLGPPLPKHRAQGPQFDRIPLAGAGAMGLHVLGCRRSHPSAGKGLAHAGDLRPQVGGDHAVTAAVGVHRRAVNQCIDPIAISLGRRDGFEQYRSSPL